MSNQVSTYGDLGETIGIYASAQFLKTVEPQLCLEKFAKAEMLPKNAGDQIRWRRIRPFPVSTTALTEGVTPAANNIEWDTVTADIYQYGAVSRYTDKAADLLDIKGWLQPVIEEHAKQNATVREQLLWNTITAGNTVVRSNGAARADINTPVDLDMVRSMARTLDRNHATKPAKMIKAGPNFSTEPIKPGYVIFGHTDMRRDFEESDNFVSVVNYAGYQPVSPYEIGSIDGHRVILTNHFSKLTSAGSSTTNGMENTNSVVDVYPFVMIAEDAFCSIAVKGDNSGRPYAEAPKPRYGDELGQRGFISWKYYFGSKILNENWLVRGECAVTAL